MFPAIRGYQDAFAANSSPAGVLSSVILSYPVFQEKRPGGCLKLSVRYFRNHLPDIAAGHLDVQ